MKTFNKPLLVEGNGFTVVPRAPNAPELQWMTRAERAMKPLIEDGCTVTFSVSGEVFLNLGIHISNGPEQPMGGFKIYEQKNCCGIMVVSGAGAHPARKGLGKLLTRLQKALAAEFKYTRMLATAITEHPLFTDSYKAAVPFALAMGWKQVDSFRNPNSGNTVGIFIHDLS